MTLVDPDDAVRSMRARWIELGNTPSPALEDAWRVMCQTLNRAGCSEQPGWAVLGMPTGIGKSQFVAAYCALLERSVVSPGNLPARLYHPGFLYISRFRDEADRFADLVNQQAGTHIAAAYHSRSSVALSELRRYPVAAITHRASELQEAASDDLETTIWDNATAWLQTRRSIVVFDEAPSFVSSAEVTSQDISQLIGTVGNLADVPPRLFVPVRQLLALLLQRSEAIRRDRILYSDELETIGLIDFDNLLAWINQVTRTDLSLWGDAKPGDHRKRLGSVLHALKTIHRQGWGWVHISGRFVVVNSPRLHPSLLGGSGVILDATAAHNAAYRLLPSTRLVQSPSGVRSYRNVKLHVARDQRVGKVYMAKEGMKVWLNVRRSVLSQTDKLSQVLVCTHKALAEHLGHGDETDPRFSFGHWGALDGKNEWNSHEAVVIMGLPYLDHCTPLNTVLAASGPVADDWFSSRISDTEDNPEDDVAAVQTGHIVSSVLQAINRIRCRRVIDRDGNCPPTSVFVLLPTGRLGGAIEAALRANMPEIQISPWTLNAPRRKRRRSGATDAFASYFATANKGRHDRQTVEQVTSIPRTTMDRFLKLAAVPDTEEHQRMAELGIEYHTTTGRGAKAYFSVQ